MNESAFEFANPLNWDLVRRQKYVARLVHPEETQYIPLPDISLTINSNVLLIGTKNQKSRASWWLGCRASIRLLISPSSTTDFAAAVEVYRQNCRLGALTLLTIPYYKPLPYLLVISVPRWHQELELEIWSYSGPLAPELGEVALDSEQLDRMEDQLAFLVNRDVATNYTVEIREEP